MLPLALRAVTPEATAGSGERYVKGTTGPTHSWGLVVLCPSLSLTNEWARKELVP